MPSPKIYLHGLLGGPDLWAEAAADGAVRHTFPGHGARPAIAQASLEAYSEDLAARLDRPSVMIGASMGAAIALIVAARHPAKVDRLILTGATPCLAAQPDFPHALQRDQIEALATGLSRDFKGTCRAFCTRLASGSAPARDRLVEAALRCDPKAAAAVLRDSAARDLRDKLGHIKAPVTIIAAEDDAITPVQAQAELADALGARFERLKHGGHAPYLTAPDTFAALVHQDAPD